MKRRTNMAVWVIALGAIVAGGFASPATAATTPPAPNGELQLVSSTSGVNQDCVASVKNAIALGDTSVSTDVCKFTTGVSTSAPQSVTLADLEEVRGSMSATEFSSLQLAAAAGTVKSKSYKQNYDNVIVAWEQSGKFYYDGSRAWVTSSYRGYTGYHTCKVNRSIGYVIDVKKCDESGSTSQRNLRAIFHSSAIPSGGLVNWSTEMHFFVNSKGSTWAG